MTSVGILDPEGKKNNPYTDKPYSDAYKKLAKIWSKYPAYKEAKSIIKTINDNQVVLVVSATGSGKTVLIPKYTAHVFKYTGNVVVTLPKQSAALSAAEFSAKTLDVELGVHVGYKYRGSPKTSKSKDTKLLYATDGTVVEKLMRDPKLSDYNAVIVDEAHERKVQIDFLLYLLREVVRVRPDFKVVIMSATINAKIFKDYFQDVKFKTVELGGQRTFPIKSVFLDKKLEYKQVLDKGFEILLKILEEDDIKKTGPHDIIFFVSSSNEAFKLCTRLKNKLNEEKGQKCKLTCNGDIFCVEFYSGMDPTTQQLAQDKELYKKDSKYTRKVVITTNVAESSLTIDGVKFVIDSGYEYKGSYDPKYRARRLDRQLITHAQAKQRMGRGGRTAPGVCYHLYTKDEFDKEMLRFPEPDIRTNDITGESLKLLNRPSIQTVSKLLDVYTKFIEPPRDVFIMSGIGQLESLGLVKNNIMTELGKLVIRTGGNDVASSIAMLASEVYGCSKEVVNILSMMDVSSMNMNSILRTPQRSVSKKNKEQYEKIIKELDIKFKQTMESFRHKYGDHLSILNMYNQFNEVYNSTDGDKEFVNKWCSERFLNTTTFVKGKKIARDTTQKLNSIKKEYGEKINNILNIKNIDEIKKLNLDDRIITSLLTGYKLNTAVRNGKKYTTKYTGDNKIELDKLSFLQNVQTDNIFYSEMFISMNGSVLNIASVVPDTIV